MVALGLSSVLFAGLASFTSYSSKAFASIANYVSLDADSRNALDRLTKDVRQVRRLTAHSATSLTFEDSDGTTLSYVYDPNARTLTRTANGVSSVLLTQCDRLIFSIFQRNPIGGSYDQYPTADVATCKLVNVFWVCSRQVMGETFNTETVQTAKIVIRKQ